MAQKLKKKTSKQKQVIVKKAVTTNKKSVETRTAGASAKLMPKTAYIEGIGRRKTAIARVRVYEEAGDFLVNDKPAGEYFKTIRNASTLYNLPFHVTETLGNWAVSVHVSGSGVKSQLDAVVHGIARVLLKKSDTYHDALKEKGLLTRDPRMKETRKVGMGGKARRQRQSPKR